jgi:hypothetical protein
MPPEATSSTMRQFPIRSIMLGGMLGAARNRVESARKIQNCFGLLPWDEQERQKKTGEGLTVGAGSRIGTSLDAAHNGVTTTRRPRVLR